MELLKNIAVGGGASSLQSVELQMSLEEMMEMEWQSLQFFFFFLNNSNNKNILSPIYDLNWQQFEMFAGFPNLSSFHI